MEKKTVHNNFYESTEEIIHSKEELCESDSWVAGVDEAGRGPVYFNINIANKIIKIGPMVYTVVYCPRTYESRLKDYGFLDSKTLTPERRECLMQALSTNHELRKNVGWSTRIISAREISEGMLRPDKSYNLNAQAHDTTIHLLSEVFKRNSKIKEIYVDTVGPSSSYQIKLQQLFPQANVKVAEKADAMYPIVSTASICAKVTRDKVLAKAAIHQELWGSGYPSDPVTHEWLRYSVDPIFGWPYEIVRYSWQTAKDILEKDAQKKDNSKVYVEWNEKSETRNTRRIQSYFKSPEVTQEGINLSWYGQDVENDF
ncbi:hypothetical protein PORY_002100 [Pneumocystis oryctolagi]|uniref:Uncharacterized protein n=1 Tax=Pneumocystis oryctolagi TaxID=42067 RepID=A0ACB7CBH1_9ASCO|nr:hypothetical protein PORY_002100 [Pneumocystis oryctolagi]